MHKKWIYAWMAGISLLLISLVTIQLIWLRDASRVEKKETELHIIRALEKTESQLKNTAYCFEMYSKTFLRGNEGIYIVRQKFDKTGFIGIPDTLNMYMDTEGFFPDSVVYKTGSFQEPYPMSVEIHSNFHLDMGKEKALAEYAKYESETDDGKKFRDIIASKRPIDSILNMRLTDSLIKVNLAMENIRSPYQFAFVHSDDNTIDYAKRVTDSITLLKSPYSIQVFEDNKFIPKHRLALAFSAPINIINGNSWQAISISIIIILMFAFYSFIRLYIKQTRLSEMKSDFINNLTHEFNTPMANISLAIETLMEESYVKEPKAQRILNIITAESGRLQENIERALQVATMEKGTLHLRKEQFDIAATINTIISSYQLQCEQLGGRIEYASPEQSLIYGDETHLLNCICNLLDNAIKYRLNAPVIYIALEEKDQSVIITVSDNGMGMDNETQKHIFEKFYRAHEGDTHNTKGFGLGLCYVKGIIEAHEGKISVWSRPGAGAKFIINLPKNIPL